MRALPRLLWNVPRTCRRRSGVHAGRANLRSRGVLRRRRLQSAKGQWRTLWRRRSLRRGLVLPRGTMHRPRLCGRWRGLRSSQPLPLPNRVYCWNLRTGRASGRSVQRANHLCYRILPRRPMRGPTGKWQWLHKRRSMSLAALRRWPVPTTPKCVHAAIAVIRTPGTTPAGLGAVAYLGV